MELQDILLNAKLVKYLDHSVTSSPIYYKSEAIHSETRGKCFVLRPSREVFNNSVLYHFVLITFNYKNSLLKIGIFMECIVKKISFFIDIII
jgi:hypothetical protein